MKANELRIGNYVDFYGHQHIVEGVSKRLRPDCGYYELSMIDMPQKGFHLKPIPLTEEWLLKFGFIEDGNTKNLFNNFGVYFQRLDNKLYLMSEDGGKRHIEFVHTAQNIHFALTGEELEIK